MSEIFFPLYDKIKVVVPLVFIPAEVGAATRLVLLLKKDTCIPTHNHVAAAESVAVTQTPSFPPDD